MKPRKRVDGFFALYTLARNNPDAKHAKQIVKDIDGHVDKLAERAIGLINTGKLEAIGGRNYTDDTILPSYLLIEGIKAGCTLWDEANMVLKRCVKQGWLKRTREGYLPT